MRFSGHLLLFTLLISGCQSAQKSYDTTSRYSRPGSQKDWGLAFAVNIEADGDSDNTVSVRSLWDEDSLYFRFDVKDADLWSTQTERDDQLLYLDDMCEILLDPRRDGGELWLDDDIIYHVNLLGTVKDDRGEVDGGQDIEWNGNAGFTVALDGTLNDSDDIDTGYTIEIAIPWTEIGKTPSKGLRINVNYGCGDRDSEERIRCLSFLRRHFPTRTPSSFATLELTL